MASDESHFLSWQDRSRADPESEPTHGTIYRVIRPVGTGALLGAGLMTMAAEPVHASEWYHYGNADGQHPGNWAVSEGFFGSVSCRGHYAPSYPTCVDPTVYPPKPQAGTPTDGVSPGDLAIPILGTGYEAVVDRSLLGDEDSLIVGGATVVVLAVSGAWLFYKIAKIIREINSN